jgi:hypothetical protein
MTYRGTTSVVAISDDHRPSGLFFVSPLLETPAPALRDDPIRRPMIYRGVAINAVPYPHPTGKRGWVSR